MIDEAQFSAYYEELFPQLFGYVSRRICDRHEVEDLVSQIWLKAAQNVSRFDQKRSSFKTWMYAITTHTLIDYFRSHKPTAPIEDAEQMQSHADMPHESTEKRLHRNLVHRVIAGLPAKHQQIIYLKYFSDLAPEEIAQTLSITPNNASVMVHRALAAFETAYNHFIS